MGELDSFGNPSAQLVMMVEPVVAMHFLKSIAPGAANGTVMCEGFQCRRLLTQHSPVICQDVALQIRPKWLTGDLEGILDYFRGCYLSGRFIRRLSHWARLDLTAVPLHMNKKKIP